MTELCRGHPDADPCDLRFIQSHFADLFRLLPESPPRMGTQEKWISSATLLEQAVAEQQEEIPPYPPRTPEPKAGTPTFQFSSPPGDSPHSVRSGSSKGSSPLTPLQFMRRANVEAPLIVPALRPVTPSNPPSYHSRTSTVPSTPSRNSWRP